MGRRKPGAVLLALSIGACLPRAEFTGFAGDGDPLVTVVASGATQQGASAQTPHYRLEFSDTGFHFPSELVMGADNMLGDGAGCNTEKKSGLSVYPAYRIDGTATLGVTAHERVIELAGPVIGKVGLDWKSSYPCTDPMTMVETQVSIEGRTTYTMFPDGRISRYDVVSPTSPFVPECRCNAENYYLTSFSAFVFDDNASLVGGPADLTGLGGAPADRTVCLAQRGHLIGFGWHEDRKRVRQSTTDAPHTIAFVHDFLGSASASLMPGTFDAATTMIATDDGTCTDVRARLEPFVAVTPPELKIAGDSVGLGTDGIYAGASRMTGTGGYPVPGATVELTTSTTIAGGFAVWLDFGTARDRYGVRHSVGVQNGEWFRVQTMPAAAHAVFWFRDALEPGATITIEPL